MIVEYFHTYVRRPTWRSLIWASLSLTLVCLPCRQTVLVSRRCSEQGAHPAIARSLDSLGALRCFHFTPSTPISLRWLKAKVETPHPLLRSIFLDVDPFKTSWPKSCYSKSPTSLQTSAARLHIFHRKVQDDKEV
ncbi:hypothetical protein EDB87DRAFT_1418115 [Lactarius vividus]|nr:hypothetical protein EDB87DRAFT_1418115 [Lactarius vividus]